jgi:hypothetical protein
MHEFGETTVLVVDDESAVLNAVGTGSRPRLRVLEALDA